MPSPLSPRNAATLARDPESVLARARLTVRAPSAHQARMTQVSQIAQEPHPCLDCQRMHVIRRAHMSLLLHEHVFVRTENQRKRLLRQV